MPIPVPMTVPTVHPCHCGRVSGVPAAQHRASRVRP